MVLYAKLWSHHSGLGTNAENEAKEGRSEDYVVSKKGVQNVNLLDVLLNPFLGAAMIQEHSDLFSITQGMSAKLSKSFALSGL